MSDLFAGHTAGLISPGEHAFAITPDDDNDLAYATRAIFVGGDGNIAVVTAGGETITIVGVVGGTLYPFRIVRVLATDTTATNLVGWY